MFDSIFSQALIFLQAAIFSQMQPLGDSWQLYSWNCKSSRKCIGQCGVNAEQCNTGSLTIT